MLLAAGVVGLDQLAKWFIRLNLDRGDSWDLSRVFRIVHVTNSGAAFEILQNAGPLLVVTSIMGMAAILIFLFNPGFAHPLMRAGLALMLGGAIGNLIDRVTTGLVVDFILLSWGRLEFYVFNVADVAVTTGVALFAIAWTRDTDAPAPAVADGGLATESIHVAHPGTDDPAAGSGPASGSLAGEGADRPVS